MIKNFVIKNNTLIEYKGKDEIIKIPENIQVIGAYAFNKNKTIKEIILPKRTKIIETNAFYECENLEKINLENITTIKYSAFENCINLKQVNINKLKNININAFNNSGLESITFPVELTSDMIHCFSGDNLKEIIVEGKLYIPNNLITNGSSVEKLNIKSNENFNATFFKQFKNIKEVEINNPNYKIKNGIVFSSDEKELIYCPPKINLSKYEIPDTVTVIKENAFFNVKSLNTLILGKNVKFIEEQAFSKCKINKILFNNNQHVLYRDIFYDSNINELDMSNSEIKTLNLEECGIFDDSTWYDISKITFTGNVILPNKINDIIMPMPNEIEIEQKISNILKIKTSKENFNLKMQNFIEKNNIQTYYKTLEELIESGKSFKEANDIIKNQER